MSEIIAQNTSEQFSCGTFENTAILNEAVALCQPSGRYIQAGGYTTPVYNSAPFTSLAASACCDTPCKTAYELLVRINVGGKWSRWLSFGKFSPLIKRKSVAESCPEASLQNGMLKVSSERGADSFQLRVYLYSDNHAATPVLNMISASVKPLFRHSQDGEKTQRELPVPAYSQMLRSPALQKRISLPCVIAMLLNRHGEDVLPEQIAHAMLDYETGGYSNINFAAAICGAYGYKSSPVFADIAFIKKEVRQGFAPAALLNDGEAIVVRGFEEDENGEHKVIINNPNASSNEESGQRWPLDVFKNEYSGICLLLHEKRKGAGTSAPQIRPANIKKTGDEEYSLYLAGLPVKLSENFLQSDGLCEGTICACARNNMAFASAAQKSFEYLKLSEAGNIIIPNDLYTEGTKITVYALDHTGGAYASEITI